MILDFKEIPEAHIPNGMQDTFEMFARDFFKEIGFTIDEGPDRGADNGRDLIVKERRIGLLGETEIIWLVSCKHKAHSGKSILDSDEENILNRVHQNHADGFIGFYSTIPSSSLQKNIKNMLGESKYKIFDRESIETILISENKTNLIERYFPESFKKIQNQKYRISNFIDEYIPLKCYCCGKDLLKQEEQGYNIISFLIRYSDDFKIEYIDDIFYCHKGICNDKIRGKFEKNGYTTHWEDISDLIIPTKYVLWIIAILNEIKSGEVVFSEIAFEKIKEIIIAVSQFTLKSAEEKDKERIKRLEGLLI